MTAEFYTEYFIDENGIKTGPLDAMTMVRRIRSGKITTETIVFVGDAYMGVRADELPEFQSFFLAEEEDAPLPPPMAEGPIRLGELLRDAWSFFSDNQLLALAAGVLLVGVTIISLFISLILPTAVAAVIACILGGFSLFLLMIYIACVISGQLMDPIYMGEILRTRGIDLLAAAALSAGIPVGIPAIISVFVPSLGLVLLLAGLALYSLFIFTPLFLLNDPTIGFMQSMKLSRRWVLSQSINNIAIVASLVAVNGLAVFLFFLPIFFTLPVTFIALCDLFIQRVNR